MYGTSRERQWHQLQRELKCCYDLLLKIQSYEPFFEQFDSWINVIGYFKKTSWYEPQSDITLRPILQFIQNDNDPRWNVVITTLFWHILESILIEKLSYDPDHSDELWQNIHSAFLQTVHTLDLTRYKYNLASLIYRKSVNRLYHIYQPIWENRPKEEWSDSQELIMQAGSYEDKEFREVIVTAYLFWFLSQGMISNVEYYLLERTLRYQESVKHCADKLGLSYEGAKKQRQRAIKKIREIEKKRYKVICNDIALRSYIVGKALIENSHIKLENSDLTRLFVPAENRSDFISKNFSPDVLPNKHTEFLDNAMAVIGQVNSSKRWLLLLLAIKYILRLRPMGNFGARTIIHQIEDRNWEAMNPNYVKDIVNRKIYGHPRAILEKLTKHINRGVFDNGQDNKAYQQDVFEFLDEIDTGDILYLDPPYAGTSSYESALRPLDSMLAGKIIKSEPSVFSRKDAFEFLEKLFVASKRYPIWVISYGNVRIDLNQLTELIKKFKKEVVAEEFHYTHLTGLSGEEHREKNRELLIYARGDK